MQWCGVEDYHVWSRLLMATSGIHSGRPLVSVSGTVRATHVSGQVRLHGVIPIAGQPIPATWREPNTECIHVVPCGIPEP